MISKLCFALGVEIAHGVAQAHEVKFDFVRGLPTFEANLDAASSRTRAFCFIDVDFGSDYVFIACDLLKCVVLSITRQLGDNQVHDDWLRSRVVMGMR